MRRAVGPVEVGVGNLPIRHAPRRLQDQPLVERVDLPQQREARDERCSCEERHQHEGSRTRAARLGRSGHRRNICTRPVRVPPALRRGWITWALAAAAFALALLAAAGRSHRGHEDRPARRSRSASSPTPPRCGTHRTGSARCRAASTAATSGRWGRSSRSATCSGCRTGWSTGSGWGSCWRSRPGERCGCSTPLMPAAARRGARRSPALLALLNPYVVVFSNRTSVTLLGYAALPWLLLAVHRGLRAPRRLVVAGGCSRSSSPPPAAA